MPSNAFATNWILTNVRDRVPMMLFCSKFAIEQKHTRWSSTSKKPICSVAHKFLGDSICQDLPSLMAARKFSFNFSLLRE